MSGMSPVRPSRRAVARRRHILESSDDEDENASPNHDENEDEDEFTPAPPKSPQRQSRRTTKAIQRTPRKATRASIVSVADNAEPSEIFSPASAIAPEPISPTRKRAPRKSIRVSRRTPVAMNDIIQDPVPHLPSPSTSMIPEIREEQISLLSPTPLDSITVTAVNEVVSTALTGFVSLDLGNEENKTAPLISSPLGDITSTAVNGNGSAVAEQNEVIKVEKKPLAFEKPMDIVVRTRALAAPVPQELSQPKSRIVITYLILTNFKSYAGRQEVGPFHSSFSSVVGPNGSGKSNVIDSLLFVFGFRASKMRQGKISALIHNSAAFPDLNHCEVEVHFQEVIDKPTGTEVVPNSTLVISRRAFKNNSSKYYINSSESNFTTVTTLLRDRGVDLDHKRFLILQGEVESIAQMKPKAANEHDDGLLEYLEDIIGTSKYKTPIEESAAEVEQLNEVCSEKQARVQHVEKEKNSLETKKDAALSYIRDENELTMKQSALYQIFINECDDNIEVTGDAVNQMQAQLDTEVGKHRDNEGNIKKMQKQYDSQVKTVEKFKKETQALLDQIAKLDKESVKFDEKKKHLNAKVKKIEKARASAQAATSEARAHLQRLDDDLERNTSTASKLETEMAVEEQELASIRESLQGKTQGLSDEISKKQKMLEPWIQQINEKQSAITVAQSELTILQEGDNAAAQAINDAKAKITKLEEEKLAKAIEIEKFNSELASLSRKAHKLQTALEELSQKEPIIRSKVSSARQKADEARSNFSKSKSQGDVLTGLMRLKESGRIHGFHGRLGDLGTIDQKYDVAISTACPSLDNLVVDSVEVGQQCIEYLRKNNLGRASLILLDRLAQRDLSKTKTPENVPRLFDLVQAKEKKFQQAFYSVMQNTLVAENLDQANRIAYGAQRWRVVTLDGQLIDKSGTMSGGGTRVSKGSMSSKLAANTTKEEVGKLEADQVSEEKTFEEFQQLQQNVTTQLENIRAHIPELETNIQKSRLGLESIERNLADSERHAAELSAAKQPTGSDKSRVKLLQKTVSGLETEIAKLQEETSGLESEIKVLQDKIMEVGGVKLRYQKGRVDGLKEQIDILNEEMSNAEVTRVRTEKQKIKQEKAEKDATKELESLAVELQQVDEDVRKQNNNASGSRKEAEEAQEALETKNEEFQALKAKVDAKTVELNETRGKEIEMRNRLEENQKALVENQKRLKYWQEKLGKLSIQNINDFGEEQPEQSLAVYTRDELADLDKNTLKGEIALLEERTQNVNVELGVLAEYRRRVEEHEQRSNDLAQAVGTRDTARKRCEELRRLRLEGFMEGFSTISLRLKEMYQMITMGGNAELELVDSLDPFSEGILFSVMPPKKSWKNISNLSGGEKTLSSLALVFALHHYKPTPLYVMDEIDAALDFRNVSIVASYIKERTKNAQFIVISLRNNMFELASRLVGVYKVNHMTKSVTVNNKDYIDR